MIGPDTTRGWRRATEFAQAQRHRPSGQALPDTHGNGSSDRGFLIRNSFEDAGNTVQVIVTESSLIE